MTDLPVTRPQPRYPKHLVSCWRLADGRVITVRPIRHDDGPLEQDFVRSLSAKTRYYRFFNTIRELSPDMLDRMTHVDYRRQMTLVAVIRNDNVETQIGVAEYVAEPDAVTCEFAVVVHDAWQHMGLGTLLIESLIRCAKTAGYASIEGDVMADNQPMLNLARTLGFSVRMDSGDARLLKVRKILPPADFRLRATPRAHPTPCAG